MRFKVPKDVDIEDRIVGPLTAKQLVWLGSGVGICIFLWQVADFQLFIFLSIIVLGFSAAFAFVRPYNQSLVGFLGSVMLFMSKPKEYWWRRVGFSFPRKNITKKSEKDLLPVIKKGFPEQDIEKIAENLDVGGDIK